MIKLEISEVSLQDKQKYVLLCGAVFGEWFRSVSFNQSVFYS